MYNVRLNTLMAKKKEFKKCKDFLEENKPEECQVCGGSLTLEKVNLEDYQGGKLFMMEQVPAFVCQECGEVWVPEPVVAEFEKMIAVVKQRKQKRAKKA